MYNRCYTAEYLDPHQPSNIMEICLFNKQDFSYILISVKRQQVTECE